jgi:hypothetical protein
LINEVISLKSAADLVATEADPTPLVLSLARTLRASAQVPELRDVFARTNGSVALKSVTDAQSASLTFRDAGVHVSHGIVDGAAQVDLHFDPEYTLGDTDDPVGKAAGELLSPPLPDWREAAAHFWDVNQGAPGFPGRIVLVCLDEEGEVAFGEGDDVYEVHGYGPALAAVLSGQLDHFLYALAFGVITVVGSAAQTSAMCAAHWKVRFGG